MDLNELLNSGKVPVEKLVIDVAQRQFVLEALMKVLSGQLTQIIANQEGREFEDVAANTERILQVKLEESYRAYLDMLAKNTQ